MYEEWLTEEHLLTLAAHEDFHPPELTSRKLKRWRTAGLLPHPRRTSLGRGKGMRSEYPPGTARQLLALCRLLRRFPHDLDAVCFALWFEGFPLQPDDLKQSLEALLRPYHHFMATVAPDLSDPLAAAEDIAEQMQARLSHSKLGRRLRRLGNDEEVNAVLTALFQFSFGGIPGFTAHADEELGERLLADLFIDALGLKRGQTDRLGEVGPWLPQDGGELGRQLEQLAGEQLISIPALVQTLQAATPAQLAQARTDLARTFEFKQMAKAMGALMGPDVFGYSLFRELPSDPNFLALLLVFLIRLRASIGPGLDEIGATLKHHRPIIQQMLAFVRTLRKEYPVVAEELLSQTQQLDWSNPQALDRFQAIFGAMRAAHPEELDAFFQRHPELRAE